MAVVAVVGIPSFFSPRALIPCMATGRLFPLSQHKKNLPSRQKPIAHRAAASAKVAVFPASRVTKDGFPFYSFSDIHPCNLLRKKLDIQKSGAQLHLSPLIPLNMQRSSVEESFLVIWELHIERERGTCARMFRFHTRFSPPIKSPLPPSLDRESTELLKGVFSAFLFLLSCFGLVLREGGSVERAKKGDSPSTPPLPRRPNPRTHPPFFPCPDSDISFLLRQGTSGSDETWAEAEESLNFPFFLSFLPFSRPRSPTHTFSAAKYSTFLAPFSKAPPPAPVILGVWPRASLGRPLVALAGWGRCWPFAYNGKRREENAASAADAGKKGVFKEKKAGLRYFLKNCTQRFLRKVNFCRDAEVQAPF